MTGLFQGGQTGDLWDRAERQSAARRARVTPQVSRRAADFIRDSYRSQPWLPHEVVYAAGVASQWSDVVLQALREAGRESSHRSSTGFVGGIGRFFGNIADVGGDALGWGLENTLGRAAQAFHAAGLPGPTRAVMRTGATVAMYPLEYLYGVGRNTLQTTSDLVHGRVFTAEDEPSAWSQTTFGQATMSFARGEGLGLGQGWFPDPDSPAAQAQAAAAREAFSVYGHAATPGRLVAGGLAQLDVIEPGSTQYNVLSGLVDLGASLKLDPLNAIGASNRAARAGRVTGFAATGSDVRRTITPLTVDGFFATTAGRRFLSNIVDIDSADELLERAPSLDPVVARDLVYAARTGGETAVLDAIRRHAGIIRNGLTPQQLIDAGRAGNLLHNSTLTLTVGMRNRLRSFAQIPVTHSTETGKASLIHGFGFENAEEVRETVRNARIYYQTAKVDGAVRRADMDALVDAITIPNLDDRGLAMAGWYQQRFVPAILGSVDTRARALLGDTPTAASEAASVRKMLEEGIRTANSNIAGHSAYLFDEAGDPRGDAFAFINGDVVELPEAIHTGHSLRNALLVPEFELLRDATGLQIRFGRGDNAIKVSSLWHNSATAIPKSLLTAITGTWKLTAVGSGRHLVKIAGVIEPLRVVLLGGVSFYNHPFQFMNLVHHGYAEAGVDGVKFIDRARRAFEAGIPDAWLYSKAQTARSALGLDDIDAMNRLRSMGGFVKTERVADPDAWAIGIHAQASAASADPIWKRVAATGGVLDTDEFVVAGVRGTIAEHVDAGRLTGNGQDALHAWIVNSPEGRKALEAERRLSRTNSVRAHTEPRFTGDDDFDAFALIESAKDGVDRLTGGDDLIRAYIADPVGWDPAKMVEGLTGALSGGTVAYKQSRRVIRRYSTRERIAQAAEPGAFSSYIKNSDNPNLPQWVGAPKLHVRTGGRSQVLDPWFDAQDKAFDWYWSRVYGRISDRLNRDPYFRQLYWNKAITLAGHLTPEEAQKLLRLADETGVFYDESFQLFGRVHKNMVHKGRLREALEEQVAKANGTNTLDDLHEVAGWQAWEDTRRLLYDRTLGIQLFDVAKLIFPFGDAWLEELSTTARLLARPTNLYRSFRALRAGRDADLDGDGRGFFWKDPITGEEMITVPFSGLALEQLTGLRRDMAMPLKGFGMTGSTLPGLGPVASFALSKIIPDKPLYDDIVALVMPYGEEETLSPISLPSWANKLRMAWTGDPESDRQFATLVADSMRALAATGEWTTRDPEELYNAAVSHARLQMMFHGIAQFVLPVAPQGSFVIDTKAGDVVAQTLAREWRDMVAAYETGDGEPGSEFSGPTPTEQFFAKFGTNPALWAQSKSRALVGGIQSSGEFSDWERENGWIKNEAPLSWAWFGPSGSEFSYEAYQRQFRTGQRELIPVREQIAGANTFLARMAFDHRRTVLEQDGELTDDERKELSDLKTELAKQYPGYDPRAFPNRDWAAEIRELERVVDEDRFDRLPVTEALRQWFTARTTAQRVARRMGLTTWLNAKSARFIRDDMRVFAAQLMARYPSFRRVYDDLLSWEFSDDVEAANAVT